VARFENHRSTDPSALAYVVLDLEVKFIPNQPPAPVPPAGAAIKSGQTEIPSPRTTIASLAINATKARLWRSNAAYLFKLDNALL
jgi:hypothetical protein